MGADVAADYEERTVAPITELAVEMSYDSLA